MKMDKALQHFCERYDRDALASIDELSQELGLRYQKKPVNCFDIKKTFENFIEFVEGYVEYKIENVSNDQSDFSERIEECVESFLNDKEKICSPINIDYHESREFIHSYTNGIPSMISSIEGFKSKMIEGGVSQEDVGYLTEMSDRFLEKMDSEFHTVMDKLLWASGYHSKQKIYNKKKATPILHPVFT